MNTEQETKLIDMSKKKLEGILLKDFIKIRNSLEDLDLNYGNPILNKNQLIRSNQRYNKNILNFREEYGLTFTEIQEKYEKLLPKINEYLGEQN
ncbi:MAG: hypothetical protein WC812_02505 [Candidatus Pacearchaeota archaeon]